MFRRKISQSVWRRFLGKAIDAVPFDPGIHVEKWHRQVVHRHGSVPQTQRTVVQDWQCAWWRK